MPVATLRPLPASACLRLPPLTVCVSVHVSACRHVSLPCQFGHPWEFGRYLTNASREQTERIISPPYALLPPLSARVVIGPSGIQYESTQARLTLPRGGCPSRLPSALRRRRSLTLSRRSVASAWTGPCRSCGHAGPEPSGTRPRQPGGPHCRPLREVALHLNRVNTMEQGWRGYQANAAR